MLVFTIVLQIPLIHLLGGPNVRIVGYLLDEVFASSGIFHDLILEAAEVINVYFADAGKVTVRADRQRYAED